MQHGPPPPLHSLTCRPPARRLAAARTRSAKVLMRTSRSSMALVRIGPDGGGQGGAG